MSVSAPPRRLDVYLAGKRIGELERQAPTRYRLRYTDDAVARHGEGALLLSASLPVRSTPYPSGATKPFFEGLLPEGAIRSTIARTLGLSEDNGFGLLAELGADCAGAVVIVPAGAPAPTPETGSIEWLDLDALAQRIADLPRNPLGVTDAHGRVRLSLAGVQPKLVVTRSPSERIGQPTGGAPSTHLIKPAQEQYPDLVANEAFCLRVARSAGLRAAPAEVIQIGGLECLLVERWDRTLDDDGRIARLHQEDFCQALGLLPAAKYETEGGPSVAAMVGLLRGLGTPTLARDLNELVRAVSINFLLGNSDAHGKNYALLYEPLGIAQVAPLYDVVSTSVYPNLSQSLAMTIGGIDDPGEVDAGAWRRLAGDSGLGSQVPRAVQSFAGRVVENARVVRDASRAEGWHRPVLDEIVELAERRAQQLEL
ncbi:MAG: type toxin-antitoxin system HipA family toxin [Thermoleophilia bacterium]|nr:type toxin-antitoxin system HipA family toxin [Thermoleophilia bacterium]